MVLIDGVKYACDTCIRGHRVTSCKHTDKPLTRIKPIGRPASQCQHCREARNSAAVHANCSCGARDRGGSHTNGCPCYDPSQKCSCPSRKNRRKTSSSGASATARPYPPRQKSPQAVAHKLDATLAHAEDVKSHDSAAKSRIRPRAKTKTKTVKSPTEQVAQQAVVPPPVANNNLSLNDVQQQNPPPSLSPLPSVHGSVASNSEGLSPQQMAELQFSQAINQWEPLTSHVSPALSVPGLAPPPAFGAELMPATSFNSTSTPSFTMEDGALSESERGHTEVGPTPAFVGSVLDDFNPMGGMVPLLSDFEQQQHQHQQQQQLAANHNDIVPVSAQAPLLAVPSATQVPIQVPTPPPPPPAQPGVTMMITDFGGPAAQQMGIPVSGDAKPFEMDGSFGPSGPSMMPAPGSGVSDQWDLVYVK